MTDRAGIRARVEGLSRFATSPAVVSRLMAISGEGTVSTAEISGEVGQDKMLAARVLKLVNWGFRGSRQPITTITHAMVLLGLDVMKPLVLTASVFDLIDAMNESLEGLWEHSLGTARVARGIAARLEAQNPEEIALAGLLHDIGKVIIARAFPAEHQRIREVVAAKNCLQIVAEQEVLGVTHPEVGMWLLKKWALPPRMVFPVAYHSNFHPRRDFADRTAIIHLADILCRAKGIGYPGDRRMPPLHPAAWTLLGLRMTDVEEVCDRLDAAPGEGSV